MKKKRLISMTILHKHRLYEKHFKRMMDFFLSALGILLLSPFMIIVFILVKLKLGSPVIFKQERLGLREKPFMMYKFRSMTNKKDRNGNLLPDEERLTSFGKKLRNTSLDELPELFNILRGDMSIVGPRPLLVEYLPYYSQQERYRHCVRPGLTGLAQINGRNFISWNDIFRYDLEYVKNISFMGDVKIILKTVVKVFAHKDIVDMTQAVPDASGQLHFQINGEDRISHRPLNIERGEMFAEGNRQ